MANGSISSFDLKVNECNSFKFSRLGVYWNSELKDPQTTKLNHPQLDAAYKTINLYGQ